MANAIIHIKLTMITHAMPIMNDNDVERRYTNNVNGQSNDNYTMITMKPTINAWD